MKILISVLAALAIPSLVPSTTLAADLGGYDEPDRVIVQRERIIERYYQPAPVIIERRVYREPREYYGAPYAAYYDRPYRRYGYAYTGYEPRHYYPRAAYGHRHHRGW